MQTPFVYQEWHFARSLDPRHQLTIPSWSQLNSVQSTLDTREIPNPQCWATAIKLHYSPSYTYFNLHLAFILHSEGKMKFYLSSIFICYVYQSTSTKIKPELKKNILTFDYGINYKYEGMLAHSFDRFYVVTKFILPLIGDLNFSK